jgi:dUTP pyrophosphatase
MESKLQLKIKKLHPDAKLPSYAQPGDAGMDLYALEKTIVPAHSVARVRTGIAIEIPEGFVGLCWDKSGLSMNHQLKTLGGVIDAGFRGELILGIYNLGDTDYVFEKHHKVMQMLMQKVEQLEIVEATELTDSARGTGGFGSTGKG